MWSGGERNVAEFFAQLAFEARERGFARFAAAAGENQKRCGVALSTQQDFSMSDDEQGDFVVIRPNAH
jgi:hypothetical protein